MRGVPIHAHVAGIAMGLVKEGDQAAVLTDIVDMADHHGDMDFKVSGTEATVTALKMDIKVTGIGMDTLVAVKVIEVRASGCPGSWRSKTSQRIRVSDHGGVAHPSGLCPTRSFISRGLQFLSVTVTAAMSREANIR